MLPMVRPYLKIPYMARESMLETLNLPALRKMPFLRCQDKDFDQVRTLLLPHDSTDLAKFVGPEDPRLFFTNDGQPLLVYSQSGRSPNICRAIYIVDARVVIPDLQKAMKKGGWDPPIVFNEQTGASFSFSGQVLTQYRLDSRGPVQRREELESISWRARRGPSFSPTGPGLIPRSSSSTSRSFPSRSTNMCPASPSALWIPRRPRPTV